MDKQYAEYLIKKTKEDYDKIAGDFDRTRSYIWSELNRFAGFTKNGDKILDFGCGNGRLLEVFREKNAKYIGADFSLNLINLARNKYKAEVDAGKADFIKLDGLKLPFPDRSFDAIYSIAVLHHIPSVQKREELLAEFSRILKPNGKIIITVWNLWQRKYLNLILKHTIKKIFGQSKADFKDILVPWKNASGKSSADRYYHCFTQLELKQIIKRAGFCILENGFFGGAKGKFNIYVIAEK